jgi:hypothetical protein
VDRVVLETGAALVVIPEIKVVKVTATDIIKLLQVQYLCIHLDTTVEVRRTQQLVLAVVLVQEEMRAIRQQELLVLVAH